MQHNEKGVIGNSVMCFHTPSTTAIDYLFYYNYSGLFYCNSTYRIQRAMNEFYEPYLFIFVNKGCMHLDYLGKNYSAYGNECLLFDCRQAHCYYADDNTIFQFVHFGGNISDYYVQKLCENQQHVFKPLNPQAISACFSRILEFTEENIPNEHLISSDIHQLLSLMMSSRETFSSLNAKRIASAVHFMEKHLHQDITLADLSNQAGLNSYYFSKLFKQYTDSSPYDYLLNLRISHAKMLLMTAFDSVASISEQCGFNSPAHFIKIFKKKVGSTPLQYRKTHARI